jgi:hypothetical protein
VVNFIRKLKRGTDKYKDILPLKCFNCDGIGHFSSKRPYAKNKGSDEEEDPKKKKKRLHHNDSDSDSDRVLFMVVEDDEKDFEEGEVDLKAELINTLERKKNKSFKA